MSSIANSLHNIRCFLITNLLFFILVLLLIGIAPELAEQMNHSGSLSFGFLAYFALLLLIAAQNYLLPSRWRKRFYLVALFEILLFVSSYFFLFRIDKLLLENAFFSKIASLTSLIPLLLFLGAFSTYHYTAHRMEKRDTAYKHARRQLKLLLPFLIPPVLLSILLDIEAGFSITPESNVGLFLFALMLLSLTFFIPWAICKLWECQPMIKNELHERLEALCKRAHFSHAGLKTWGLLESSPTAAILGVFAKSRYVLFTQNLLHNLSPQAVEAVLAHEIGHSKRKHLLFFPLIFLGLAFFLSFISLALPDFKVGSFTPFITFVIYAILAALYLRLVFGFFSRLFERQADLHGLELGLPLSDMIEALYTLAIITGEGHGVRNWHHFSLADRIAFLKQVEKKPFLAKKHHQKVRIAVLLFALILLASAWILLGIEMPN